MRLSEYSDEELINEVKHRGLKIIILQHNTSKKDIVLIGGVRFEF